jgi:alpha-tubulin suppressor-like RCC1 family protein
MRLWLLTALVSVPVFAACDPLGDPHPEPAPVVELGKTVQISAGAYTTCAVLDNGNGACWGADTRGQLGGARTPRPDADSGEARTGSSVPRWVALDRDPVAIAAARVHGCALVAGGEVRCWGQPGGFLGVSDEGCPATGGCVVPPTPVPGLSGALAIAAGAASGLEVLEPLGSTCVIAEDRRLLCWGDNRGGKLGGGDSVEVRAEPRQVLDERGFPLRDVTRVAIGGGHACAIAASEVWCWGAGSWGTGGAGAYARRVDGIGPAIDLAAGLHHVCAARGAGDVVCWGGNANGQSGRWTGASCGADGTRDCVVTPQVIEGISGVRAVAAGDLHTCALTAAGRVVCWGSNERGQVGRDELSLEALPHTVRLGTATAITAGGAHSCALVGDGAVWCWGDDSSGQLGRGDDA